MAEIIDVGSALAPALALLERGEIVALPTETVYGVAGDASSGAAVARIFAAKGRPSFNPLIVHAASVAMARRIGVFDPLSLRLAEHFWPGPLTLVLPLAGDAPVHPLATAGLATVAIRIPVGFARDLIERLGRPLAAPSANSSGRISPTTAEAVNADLGARLALIIDGGPAAVGVESTIVKVEDNKLFLLRPGGVTIEQLQAVAGLAVRRPGATRIEAPGMLRSHYAPRAPLRLNISQVGPGEALLAFGPERAGATRPVGPTLNLSPTGDLQEAAANLFAHLRCLDDAGAATIAVEPIPITGLGAAINDRLARAAAPREVL